MFFSFFPALHMAIDRDFEQKDPCIPFGRQLSTEYGCHELTALCDILTIMNVLDFSIDLCRGF